METWRQADMETGRHGDMERWRLADLQTYRHTYIVYCTRSFEFDTTQNCSSNTDFCKQKAIQHRARARRLSVYTPNRQIGQSIYTGSYTGP